MRWIWMVHTSIVQVSKGQNLFIWLKTLNSYHFRWYVLHMLKHAMMPNPFFSWLWFWLHLIDFPVGCGLSSLGMWSTKLDDIILQKQWISIYAVTWPQSGANSMNPCVNVAWCLDYWRCTCVVNVFLAHTRLNFPLTHHLNANCILWLVL